MKYKQLIFQILGFVGFLFTINFILNSVGVENLRFLYIILIASVIIFSLGVFSSYSIFTFLLSLISFLLLGGVSMLILPFTRNIFDLLQFTLLLSTLILFLLSIITLIKIISRKRSETTEKTN